MPATGIWGGVASGLGGIASSVFGSSSAARAARDAAKMQIQMYKNRYQWQRADLRRAGYNPILAMTHGAGPVGQAPMAQTFDPSAGLERGVSALGKAVQARLNRKHEILMDEQTNTQRSQQALHAAQADAAVNAAYQSNSHGYLYALEAAKLKQAFETWNQPGWQGNMLRTMNAYNVAGLNAGSVTNAVSSFGGRLLPTGRLFRSLLKK